MNKKLLLPILVLAIAMAFAGCQSAVDDAKKAGEEASKAVNEAGEAAKKAGEEAGEAASKAADKAGEAVSEAGDAAKKAGEEAGEAVSEAGDAVKKAGEEAGEKASEAAEKAGEAASEAGDAVKKAGEEAGEKASEVAEKAGEAAGEKTTVSAEMPGQSGFAEIEIGEEQLVGPYKVAAVYFQAVDMVPAGKNPTKEESDLHLEADIHFQTEAAAKYGFGSGDNIWPAYLTVKYTVKDKDGNAVTEGSFMPMNADDGPHYGANIKKDILTVGRYTLEFKIEPPTDYLLHVDDVTGVPAKKDAESYFQTHTATFEWDYTAEQLQNE